MVLWDAERAVRSAAAVVYDGLGVTPTQGKLLQALNKAPSSTSQAQLAKQLGIDAALAGRVVDELHGRGFVRRKKSPDDARRYVVELSAAGQRKAAACDAAFAGVFARVDAALSDDDAAAFAAAVERIKAALVADEDADEDDADEDDADDDGAVAGEG